MGVLLGVPAVAILVAAWPPAEQVGGGAGPDVDRVVGARPGLWRLVPLVLGLAVCGGALLRDFGEYISDPEAYAVLVGVALAGFGLLLAAPVLVRLVADLGVKVARGPVTTIATRRLQARPGSVLRVVATLMAALVVMGGAPGVLTAFKDLDQYREAERSLSEGQLATVVVNAADVASTSDQLTAVSGIERVIELPVAEVRIDGQDPEEEALRAVIATCADLEYVGAQVADCVEGRVLMEGSRPDLLAAETGAVTPLVEPRGPHTEPVEEESNVGNPSVDLDLSEPLAFSDGGLFRGEVEGIGDLVVPPDTDGISEIASLTDHHLVVLGPPGRGLRAALDEAEIWSYSMSDTEDYDFVEGLFTLMSAVTAMLLALGLLAVTVALIDRAAARRQENASLRALGTSPGVLRRAQFLEALLPVLLGTVSAVLVGWIGGNAWSAMGEVGPVSVPWLLLVGAVAASFVVAGVTAVVVGSDPRPEEEGRG